MSVLSRSTACRSSLIPTMPTTGTLSPRCFDSGLCTIPYSLSHPRVPFLFPRTSLPPSRRRRIPTLSKSPFLGFAPDASRPPSPSPASLPIVRSIPNLDVLFVTQSGVFSRLRIFPRPSLGRSRQHGRLCHCSLRALPALCTSTATTNTILDLDHK